MMKTPSHASSANMANSSLFLFVRLRFTLTASFWTATAVAVFSKRALETLQILNSRQS